MALHLKKLKEDSKEIISLDDLIILSKDSNKVTFLIFDDYRLLKSVDNFDWYNLADLRNGIFVSGDLDEQELFITNNDYSSNNLSRDDAVVINNGKQEFIKFVNIE